MVTMKNKPLQLSLWSSSCELDEEPMGPVKVIYKAAMARISPYKAKARAKEMFTSASFVPQAVKRQTQR